MPRIAHIVESFDNQAVENWLLRSYNELDKLDLVVMKDVYFISTKSTENINKFNYNYRFINFSESKIIFLLSLFRFLRAEKIEVLYSHHDITSGFYFLVKLFLPIKTVMHVHNCSLVNPFNNGNFFFRTKAFFLWALNCILTDKVVCISLEVEKVMKNYFVLKKEIILNYYYHPMGQDRSETEITLSKKGLCYVGRLVPEKNPIRILNIFAEVFKLDPSITLDIYGEGAEKDSMIEFAIKEKLIDNVFFHGWTYNSAAAFQNHQLFLFPRFERPKEGLGLVYLESQYNQTKVLTSNCFSPEVNISNIFFSLPLVCSNNVWARKIIDLIQNETESMTYNENKRFFSKSYLVEQLSYYNGNLICN